MFHALRNNKRITGSLTKGLSRQTLNGLPLSARKIALICPPIRKTLASPLTHCVA